MELSVEHQVNLNFTEKFKNVFTRDIQIFIVVDKGTNSYLFKFTDVVESLGFPRDQNHNILSLVDFKYQKQVQIDSEINIFLTEAGFFQLILNVKSESSLTFQRFVYEELLPNVRKIVEKNHNEKIQTKQLEINSLVEQNKLLFAKMDCQMELIEDISSKLHLATEERAPIPTMKKKVERFVLLKRNYSVYPYYVVRSQIYSATNAIKKQESVFGPITILLDFTTHPNSKTFYSRVKSLLHDQGVFFNMNSFRIDSMSSLNEEDIINTFKEVYETRKMVNV